MSKFLACIFEYLAYQSYMRLHGICSTSRHPAADGLLSRTPLSGLEVEVLEGSMSSRTYQILRSSKIPVAGTFQETPAGVNVRPRALHILPILLFVLISVVFEMT
jgi:hypothetical protein